MPTGSPRSAERAQVPGDHLGQQAPAVVGGDDGDVGQGGGGDRCRPRDGDRRGERPQRADDLAVVEGGPGAVERHAPPAVLDLPFTGLDQEAGGHAPHPALDLGGRDGADGQLPRARRRRLLARLVRRHARRRRRRRPTVPAGRHRPNSVARLPTAVSLPTVAARAIFRRRQRRIRRG